MSTLHKAEALGVRVGDKRVAHLSVGQFSPASDSEMGELVPVVPFGPQASKAVTLQPMPSLVNVEIVGPTTSAPCFVVHVDPPGNELSPRDEAVVARFGAWQLEIPEARRIRLQLDSTGAEQWLVTVGDAEDRAIPAEGPGLYLIDPGFYLGPFTVTCRRGTEHFSIRGLIRPGPKLDKGPASGSQASALAHVLTMYEDVRSQHAELLLGGTTMAGLGAERGIRDLPPAQRLCLIRRVFGEERVESALEQILHDPHRRVLTQRVIRERHQVRRIATGSLLQALTAPAAVLVTQASPTSDPDIEFLRLPERAVRIDYDTPPNRFLRFAAERVADEMGVIADELGALAHTRSDRSAEPALVRLAAEAREHRRAWRHMCLREPISDVTPVSAVDLGNSVLQNDARYRAVLRAYLALRQGVAIPELRIDAERILQAPLRLAYHLYEYWCVFQVDGLLRKAIYPSEVERPESRLMFDVAMAGSQTAMSGTEPKKSTIKASYDVPEDSPLEAQSIEMFYDWSTRKKVLATYSHHLRPDITLVVRHGGKKRFMVFDAKYRLKVKHFKSIDGVDGEVQIETRGDGHKDEDINKMHTYRDALSLDGGPDVRPEWAIALYPGDEGDGVLFADPPESETSEQTPNVEEFLRKWIGGETGSGVGALALLPEEYVAED